MTKTLIKKEYTYIDTLKWLLVLSVLYLIPVLVANTTPSKPDIDYNASVMMLKYGSVYACMDKWSQYEVGFQDKYIAMNQKEALLRGYRPLNGYCHD